MSKLFDIPTIENETVPTGTAFLMPQVHVVVYEPRGEFKAALEEISATEAAIIDAYVESAKHGEIGVIKNIEQ